MNAFDDGKRAGKRYSKTGIIDGCPFDLGDPQYEEWYKGVWQGRGEQAREDRIAFDKCPYASNSVARGYWEKGWKG